MMSNASRQNRFQRDTDAMKQAPWFRSMIAAARRAELQESEPVDAEQAPTAAPNGER